MATTSILEEIYAASGTAWKVYDLGWVQDQASSQHFADFGSVIQNLAQSLNSIIRVVENARHLYQQHFMLSPQFRGYHVQKDWHLPSLYEIVGQFKTTLDDCEKALMQNREAYRGHHGSNYNNEWTMVIQPKVNDLKSRVQTHLSRLSAVLKPLEIKLLADIRNEFGIQPTHNNFGQILPPLQLRGLLGYDLDQALNEIHTQHPIPIGIPTEIEAPLRALAEQARPELRIPGGLPLQIGAEAFYKYFEEGTKGFTPGNFLNEKTPTSKQYINLLQCLIILNHLQKSDELKRADQNSLWPFYIPELANMLRSECQRFTMSSPQQLVAPDIATLSNEFSQPVYNGSQWKKEEITSIMSPHVDTQAEEVFKVPLPCPEEALHRELTICRIDSSRLRLVESVVSRDTSQRLGEIVLEVDVKTVSLIPIYATPTSRPRPLEVLLHTGTCRLNPTFLEPKHVLRLQHLLTGYKVYDRYDQAMVKVSFVIDGQSTTVEEHGRVQLWLPQPFQPVNSLRTTASSPLASDANTIQGAQSTIRQSTAHQYKQTPSPIVSVVSNGRSNSIRKWIPGFGRSSGAARTLSNGSGSTSPSVSASSSHTSSPPHSPESPNTRPNFAPIMEEARFGHPTHSRDNSAQINYAVPVQMSRAIPVQVTSPVGGQPGPYELPGDGPMVTSPYLGDGLYPVSPTSPSANPPPMAEVYRSFGLDRLSPQDRAALGLDKTTSPTSPGNQLNGVPLNGQYGPSYNNLAPNNLSPNTFQAPPSNPSSNPSPLSSNVTISHGSSIQLPFMQHGHSQASIPPNYTPYDPTDFPSSHIPPSQAVYNPTTIQPGYPPRPHNPPPAPSTIYSPTLQSKHGRPSPSVMTSMTSRSISSLAPTVSTIKTSSTPGGGIARLHRKPQKPLLVLFLKSRDNPTKLSIVAIQIDSHTAVKRDRCDCYNSHSGCRISCVEREKGTLLAQRWDADGEGSWNLAKLSQWQRKEGEHSWPGLRRVSLKFEKMEDRYKFAGSPCSCHVKTTRELSRCNLDSHNGLFGIVKQIGEQVLLNYHNERDQAKGRTMVIGSVPEGGIVL